jgi:hypothetical protein
MIRGRITSTTVVTFDRDIVGSPATESTIYYQVVELGTGIVQAGTENLPIADGEEDVTITEVDMETSIALGGHPYHFGKTPETDTGVSIARHSLRIFDPTTLRITREFTEDFASDAGWFVINFNPATPSSDSQIAYIHGQSSTLDSTPAFLHGGVNVTDSQTAYLEGVVQAFNITSNQAAYLTAEAFALDNQSAYLVGQAVVGKETLPEESFAGSIGGGRSTLASLARLNISLYTVDVYGIQHAITDYSGVNYSNHYSAEGSGYGFLSFRLDRLHGANYQDIGHGFDITLAKGLRKTLFKGKITQIQESTDNTIEISCVGYNTLLTFDILNFVLADNRTNRWSTACNPRGSYRPDKFDHSLNWTTIINEGTPQEDELSFDGIELTPRRGVEYNEDDYYYMRYRFEFGEIARILQGTYELALPNNWPGRVDILDANENVLFTQDVSGNGTLNVDLDSSVEGNFVEIRFVLTATGDNTAEDGTVYFRLYDILVLSTDDTLDAAVVITAVAEHMNTYFGFSDDYSLIDTIGYEIPQAAYDADETLDKICSDASQYGDINAKPLAWGTSFDDIDRMFLEVQDLTTVGYIIKFAQDTTVEGDLAESYQKVYGKFTNVTGTTERTAVLSAEDEIDGLGGLYRLTVIDLDKEVTSDQMIQALTVALNENKEPKISTSFTVNEFIETEHGAQLPIEDIIAGRLVQVPSLQATETSILDDKRTGFHSFMLSKVEVDLDNRTAKLTPAGDIDDFETYMTLLGRLAR